MLCKCQDGDLLVLLISQIGDRHAVNVGNRPHPIYAGTYEDCRIQQYFFFLWRDVVIESV